MTQIPGGHKFICFNKVVDTGCFVLFPVLPFGEGNCFIEFLNFIFDKLVFIFYLLRFKEK